MTKEYALRKLLEHGELDKSEIRIITNWRWDEVDETIRQLINQGAVIQVHGTECRRYRLKT